MSFLAKVASPGEGIVHLHQPGTLAVRGTVKDRLDEADGY